MFFISSVPVYYLSLPSSTIYYIFVGLLLLLLLLLLLFLNYMKVRFDIRYYCQTLIKLELSRQSLEKFSNIKFNENLSSGRRTVPCRRKNGQKDGQI